MSGFADHFSAHAALYASARPHYPDALFDWLAERAPAHQAAWDAGCGNGQAALALARVFDRVHASDPSAEQVAAASAHPRVDYRVEPAEAPSLADASVDLVCVAQAWHWFDRPRFHAQVQRVLRRAGVLAVFSYGLCRVDPQVDALCRQLHDERLGPWWPAERRQVMNGYRELDFPYPELTAPAFAMVQHWTLPAYLAYLGSWSAVQRRLRATGQDAVAECGGAFAAAWGDPAQRREVRFPLALRVGRRGD